FQAEDGIRDRNVTGVQTCALPICKVLRLDAVAMTHAHPDHFGGIGYLLAHFHPREFWWSGVPGSGVEWERLAAAVQASGARIRRSEGRRGGKECRSRWVPEDSRKR